MYVDSCFGQEDVYCLSVYIKRTAGQALQGPEQYLLLLLATYIYRPQV